MEMNEHRKMKV